MTAATAPIQPPEKFSRRRDFLYYFLGPAGIYLFCFVLLTFPLITHFSTHFFADDGDGFQHVWNLWWINHAIIDLHQSPWFTTDLHFPHGSSLLAHALDLTDGLIGLVLQRFLTLAQAFNVIVVFDFVASGLAAFWLAYIFSQSYVGSLIGGFVFTFCNFHFAHAQGHLELISIEWIPLFAICWHRQLQRASLSAAVGSALFLIAAFFCTYYFFLYCIFLAALILVWFAIEKTPKYLMQPRQLRAMSLFLLITAIAIAPTTYRLLALNHSDPFQDNHLSTENSMDLLSPLIYGGHWKFAFLTRWFWSRLPSVIHETSVHIGLTVLFLIGFAWAKRRKLPQSAVGLWVFVFLFFIIMALGPKLNVAGRSFQWIPLPYRLLEICIPPLQLSGMPIRMEIMAQLAASVLVACAIKLLLQLRPRGRAIVAVIVALLVVEYLPAPIPATPVDPPAYITALASVRGPGAVLDRRSTPTHAMYYATIYQRPLAFGYLSRIPLSVLQKDSGIYHFLTARDFGTLNRYYGFRFLIVDPSFRAVPGRIIYEDPSVVVYDFASPPMK